LSPLNAPLSLVCVSTCVRKRIQVIPWLVVMVRLPRFAGIRTVSGGSRGVFPSSVFTRIPKPASVFALSPWVSQNVRTIATQRKRGVWRTYLQPIMMLGGFILVSSVVLAIGGAFTPLVFP
jgi:hypothetical protein